MTNEIASKTGRDKAPALRLPDGMTCGECKEFLECHGLKAADAGQRFCGWSANLFTVSLAKYSEAKTALALQAWIPVTESLPTEDFLPVQIWCPDDEVEVFPGYRNDGQWFDWMDLPVHPTHWKPMSAPPAK